MPDTASASPQPSLVLNGLPVPVAGEVTSAAQMREALQQLLDNDAALQHMMSGQQVQTFAVPILEPLEEWERRTVQVAVPPVGLVLAVSGPSGRVTCYRHGQDDAARPIYEPPSPVIGPVFDVGLGMYGGRLDFDRPLPYAMRRDFYAPTGLLTLDFTAWADFGGGVTLELEILPLGDWVETAQAT